MVEHGRRTCVRVEQGVEPAMQVRVGRREPLEPNAALARGQVDEIRERVLETVPFGRCHGLLRRSAGVRAELGCEPGTCESQLALDRRQ